MFRVFEAATGSRHRQRFFDWLKDTARYFRLYSKTTDEQRAEEYLEWLKKEQKELEGYLEGSEPPF
jgi:hypothetical protein